MHQDNHKASGCDQSNADDVQPHSQPAHCAAEQVKRGLVVIQQLLVPETNTGKVSRLHEPDVLQIIRPTQTPVPVSGFRVTDKSFKPKHNGKVCKPSCVMSGVYLAQTLQSQITKSLSTTMNYAEVNQSQGYYTNFHHSSPTEDLPEDVQ